MPYLSPLRSVATGLAAISLSACSTVGSLAPVNPSDPGLAGTADVTPVMTEHSFGLQCLGSLIEESRQTPVVIHIDTIRDRTIPNRLNDVSRLSQASEWLVTTAISKLETPRVRSTLEDDTRKLGFTPAFTIDGAWTQDDELLRQAGGLGSIEWLRGRFRLGADREFDYIAGDFVTRKDGIIEYSTAIGVFVGATSLDARLLVDDGVNSASIGFDSRWADGPQLAQRRIAEAATLIHVARYFGIDYRPCLENGLGDPQRFRASLDQYVSLSRNDRQRMVQSALNSSGYHSGNVDGVWGPQTRSALMAFQADKGIPITGELSPSVFAILLAEASAQEVSS